MQRLGFEHSYGALHRDPPMSAPTPGLNGLLASLSLSDARLYEAYQRAKRTQSI